jgi:hypothetical protein
MKITVPVTINVEVEFDMTDEEAATFLDGEDLGMVNLTTSTRRAISEALHQDTGLVDDMVEYITDETGWCINSLSMETL